MMAEQAGVPITVPFDHAFYEGLIAKRDDFSLVSSHEVPAGRGYGFHVNAGQGARADRSSRSGSCRRAGDRPDHRYLLRERR